MYICIYVILIDLFMLICLWTRKRHSIQRSIWARSGIYVCIFIYIHIYRYMYIYVYTYVYINIPFSCTRERHSIRRLIWAR